MIETVREVIDSFSQPAYTGENRCWPCTVINGIGVGIATLLFARHHRALGLFVALLGGTAIWLRGYILPGTPRFAPRLVALFPTVYNSNNTGGIDSGSLAGPPSGSVTTNTNQIDSTDDTTVTVETSADDAARQMNNPDAAARDSSTVATADPDGIGNSGDSTHNPEEIIATLLDAEALIDDNGILRLADGFHTVLDERVETLKKIGDKELAKRAAAIAGENVVGEVHNGRILLDGQRDVWISWPIAVAETAIGELLCERDVDQAVARNAARPLRAFLETCPACGGLILDTTLQNCCGGPGSVSGHPERPVRACADCEAVIFTEQSSIHS
jgi:hypothetical protein